MEEEDDDFYNPTDLQPTTQTPNEASKPAGAEVKAGDLEDGEEEEVEEEEDDEDDFKIITEAPPRTSVEPVAQPPRQAILRNENRRSASVDPTTAARPGTPVQRKVTPSPAPAAAKPAVPTKPGSAYPAQHTSTIDVNANPVHPQTSKPLLSTDLDADFPSENDKPWRQPGSDITDYFNYGFDEFTWASYCLKQQELRKEVGDQKKQMEEMQAFLGMPGGGMPGMPGAPPQPTPNPQAPPGPGPGPPGSGPGPGPQNPMAGMPSGMPEMSQEMMQGMLGAMMAQGLDPTSMDPMTFMQHAQAMMGGQPGGGGAQGGQPGFGGQPQNQGFSGRGGGPQQMGFGGYDQRGGFDGGRGRGGRRW